MQQAPSTPRHATLGGEAWQAACDPLQVAKVNPKGLVLCHECMHVHGICHPREGGASGFGMRHDAVKVGAAEIPAAEGAPVDASDEVEIVLAGLQPPEDVTSLGVEGLVVAVYVAAQLLQLHSNEQ